MVRILKKIGLILLFLLLLTVVLKATYFYRCNKLNNVEKTKHLKELIGHYRMDIKRTNLGRYINKSDLYSSLELSLNEDTTFKLNMEVPFIYDTIGKWSVSGNSLDEMNNLIYQNNNKIHTQFTQLYKNNTDSIFYLNSATPKKGQDGIKEIYFIKK